jgi:integrase
MKQPGRSAPLVKALTMPKVTHRAAIVDPVKVGQLLRAIEGFEGQITTKLALRLALHVFARPGELRHADWSEVDFDNAKWISRNVEIGVMGSGREW